MSCLGVRGPTLVAALATMAAAASAGCAKDPDYGTAADAGSGGNDASGPTGTGGRGGAGGGAGAGGMAGRGDYSAPACDPSTATMGKIAVANPIVSLKRPVKASAKAVNAEKAVDGIYAHNGLILQAADLPGWIAISVAPGPTRLLLLWTDTGYSNYTSLSGLPPIGYQILTSGDSTDGEQGTWTKVAEVSGNTVRTRAHSFDFTGQTWVKFLVTTSTGPMTAVGIDEIALYDISQAAGTAPAGDSWLFMGDSITAGAFVRTPGVGAPFDELVHAARPAFTPAMVGAGIGSELSGNGLTHTPQWLMLNPDISHVAILYGTNDAWGDRPPTTFEANMRGIVDMFLAAGRIPILARIPYSAQAPTVVPQYNAIIDRISTEKGLPCGPDLYGWFRDHPEEIDPTDAAAVHPSAVGYHSINRLWAEAMLGLYPAP